MISSLPEDVGLTTAEAGESAAWIAGLQTDSGAIPWEASRHVDTWNHVEAAMGLDAGGLHDAAARAYEWLRTSQRRDGSWFAGYRGGNACDRSVDVNFCGYVAAGVWHHYLSTRDCDFLSRLWPCVEAAVGFVLSQQAADGTVNWAIDRKGTPWPQALLSSCSSIFMSIGSALAISSVLGRERLAWESGLRKLGQAIRERPDNFLPKERYSMDWYYPVLVGALDAKESQGRIESGWDTFVVEGLGVRCVADRPWVTVAETCELVIALTTLGWHGEAARLFEWTRELRCPSGAYWTGVTIEERTPWPVEKTTWTAGAVLLASGALSGDSAVAALFRSRNPAQDP
ncbi:MAG: prenyltransferase [Chloroflexi bacterium]|nr:MAG: prenyltransferase [Chloroflexota bacterium]